jgi:hypothetical protein
MAQTILYRGPFEVDIEEAWIETGELDEKGEPIIRHALGIAPGTVLKVVDDDVAMRLCEQETNFEPVGSTAVTAFAVHLDAARALEASKPAFDPAILADADLAAEAVH